MKKVIKFLINITILVFLAYFVYTVYAFFTADWRN